ncbi:MAG: hypothetical protein A3F47_00965 [Candidatus Staskawiczbacteria bacterium RIFCSPHIGHO2_12_FULL_38_11]|uniref:Prepilin peptidase n=1 Tax=Candidatus Staskawiczbacteria bacterium RIFCSPHIGHO2_12_FULL_38_11 TaxID=1802209 RepID=A0A1G2I3Z7_9BACT|nr:MAG: hypothetical protein A3F47_00965 [Candidatus Staskawiczbacteria bacterium RIFCSPHIGHO2_12_FULL_38_11]
MTIILLYATFIFLFGLIIGSFLNVVIYRLEKEENLNGRSYCPHCKHTLGWLDLVPVFSFLFLGGQCRYCKAKISWQYPLVEIATGIVFLLIFSYQPAITFQQIITLCFMFYVSCSMIVIFVYDLKYYLIPDKVLFPAIATAFLYRIIFNFNDFILSYLLAVLIAAGFFLAIYLISKGAWMGFGDVKLAILMGLVLGFPNILAALFLAFFFGAIIGIGAIFLQKKGLKSEIPFGPFLIVGTFMAMFFGGQIINWYLQFLIAY